MGTAAPDPPAPQTVRPVLIHPEGFAENVGDKLGFVKRQITGDLKRFKEYIEDRGRETVAGRGEA